MSQPITILLPGAPGRPPPRRTELAAAAVQEVVALEAPALEPYTPDGYTAALQAAIVGSEA